MADSKRKKCEIITFKVDSALHKALKNVENRSEFIRDAVLAALDNVCPLCNGLGVLSLDQRRHWNDFVIDHSVEKCEDCDAIRLVCSKPLIGSL